MLLSFIVLYLPAIALLSLLLYLPVFFICRKKHGKEPFLRHLARYLLIGFAISIVYLTILWYGIEYIFERPEYYLLNLTPFVWLKETYVMGWDSMIEQILLNIAMFVPLGFLLPAVFAGARKWYKTLLLVAGVSLFIETVQYFIGRSSDIDDLIMNTLGGILGYALFALLNLCFKNRRAWCGMLGKTDTPAS